MTQEERLVEWLRKATIEDLKVYLMTLEDLRCYPVTERMVHDELELRAMDDYHTDLMDTLD